MKFSALATSSMTALALALSACGPDDGTGAGRDAPAATEITQDQGEAGLAALNLADNPQISWGERSFEDGVFTFSELAFTPEGEAGEAFTIEQFSLAAPRVNDDGQVEFDRLEALGLNGGEDDGQVRVARIYVDHPGPGLSAAIADMLSGRANADTYELDIDDISRFRFEGIGIEGVDITETDAGNPVAISLTGFTMDDFDGDKLAAMVMTGLSLTATDPETGPVRFGLAEFSVEGLDGALVRGMADAEGNPEEAMQALSDWMMPVNLFDRFAMRGLDINAAGVQIAMPEMTSQVTERGDEIVMTSAMPALSITGEAGTPAGAQVAQALDMLGYDSFELSMGGETVYEPETDRYYTRGENYLELEDGLRISVDQDFGGFQAYMDRYSEVMAEIFDEVEDGDAAMAGLDRDINAMMMEAYEPLVLHSMRVAVEDRSLIERALGAAAAQQGVTPEEVRTQLVGLIGMGVMMAPPEMPRPLVSSLSQALMGFVQQGGTLVVEANPEEPVSVGTIMEAAEAGNFDPALVGLNVTHMADEDGK